VEGNLYPGGYRGFGYSAGDEAHSLVKVLEFGAVVDEAEFQFVESSGAALGFGGGHELSAEALALAHRFDRDEAEVGGLATGFDKEAGGQRPVVFAQKEFSASQHSADSIGVNPFAFDVGAFGNEGTVHEADDSLKVARFAVAEGQRGHANIVVGKRYELRATKFESKRPVFYWSFFNLLSSEVGWMPRILAA
jgi:hypothetical protein